jgi:hypothetical protein
LWNFSKDDSGSISFGLGLRDIWANTWEVQEKIARAMRRKELFITGRPSLQSLKFYNEVDSKHFCLELKL